MTASRITEQQPSTLTTATDSPVWGQRNLKVGAKILDDLKTAKRISALLTLLKSRPWQRLSTLDLNNYWMNSGTNYQRKYIGPGIKITVASSTRYSEKGYSAIHKQR